MKPWLKIITLLPRWSTGFRGQAGMRPISIDKSSWYGGTIYEVHNETEESELPVREKTLPLNEIKWYKWNKIKQPLDNK